MLLGTRHYARSSSSRTSNTVTGSPRSNMPRKVSASMAVCSLIVGLLVLTLDRQAGRPPVGQTLGEPPRSVVAGSQERYRLVQEDAVRPPAVGYDLPISWQLLQVGFEPLERNRPSTGDVPRPVLLLRAHVQH